MWQPQSVRRNPLAVDPVDRDVLASSANFDLALRLVLDLLGGTG
jgi:hypothetical protein